MESMKESGANQSHNEVAEHLESVRAGFNPKCSPNPPQDGRPQPPELGLKVCGFSGLNPVTTTLSIRENDKRQISTTLMRVVITAGEHAAHSPPYEELFTV